MGGGGVDLPNVSYTIDENKVYYNPIQPSDEIWYMTTDGNIGQVYSYTTFYNSNSQKLSIISNTYTNNIGKIKLNGNLDSISGYGASYDSQYGIFYNSNNVNAVFLPSNITKLDKGAFGSCSSLTGITIPDSVTTIGSGAFYRCSSLTGITIPNSVTSIGSGAFYGWTGAASTDNIIFPNEQLKIKYFNGSNCFSGWSSLLSVKIPDGVTSIPYRAFINCTSLVQIAIPNSVTIIKQDAFSNCSHLGQDFKLPPLLTEISGSAFFGCLSLQEIEIPSSVNFIGYTAFRDCSTLSRITMKSATPPTIDEGAFSHISSEAKIYVPSGSVDAYKSADGWSDYADIIETIS